METFGKICLTTLLALVCLTFSGFVFTKLWEWFVVTQFNVVPLTIAHAIGLLGFIAFAFKPMPKSKEGEKRDLEFVATEFATVMLKGGVALLFGYITTLFL